LRAVIASGLAATDRKIDLAVYPRNAWPSDRDVPRILRTAMQPHSTDNTAALIAVGGLQLTFENRTTSITVPGTQPAERAIHRRDEAIPVGEGVGPGVRLHQHKIGIIAVASNEMLKNPSAEDLVRSILIESTASCVDRCSALIRLPMKSPQEIPEPPVKPSRNFEDLSLPRKLQLQIVLLAYNPKGWANSTAALQKNDP
jgi:hypothetical protein